MAHTNIMVSYAPAPRRASRPERVGTASDRGWSAVLAGALLTGSAVFALGQFVAVDGSLREGGFPAKPDRPSSHTGTAPSLSRPEPADRASAAQPEALPYLALVRDAKTAPAPAPTPVMRRMASPIPRTVAGPPRDSATSPAVSAPAAVAAELTHASASARDPARQPALPPGRELRRDLAGFLQSQGHDFAPSEDARTLPAAESELLLETPVAAQQALAGTPSLPGGPGPAAESGNSGTEQLAGVPQPLDPPSSAAQIPAADAPAIPPAHLTAVSASAHSGLTSPSEGLYIQSYPLAVMDGEALGAVTLRDGGANGQAIHLAALVGLFKLRMPEAEFARLNGAAAADSFVTLDQLRAAGITVQYDAAQSRLLIDSR